MKYMIKNILTLSSYSFISQYSSGNNSMIVHSSYSSPSLIRKHFSTGILHPSSVQLVYDLTKIYNLYKDLKFFPSMTTSQFLNLVEQILDDQYSFKPLEYLHIESQNTIDDLIKIKDILLDFPYSEMYSYLRDGHKIYYVMSKASNLEDSIVLKAISVTLQRLLYKKIYFDQFHIKRRYLATIKYLEYWTSAPKIYKITIQKFSLRTDRLINANWPFNGDHFLNKQLLSMYRSPILHKRGENTTGEKMILAKLPHPFGDINTMLMDIDLRERFDRTFIEYFPKFIFRRIYTDIFLIPDREAIHDFYYPEILSHLSQIGVKDISCEIITPGGHEISCGGDHDYEPGEIKVGIAPCGRVFVTDNSVNQSKKDLWGDEEDLENEAYYQYQNVFDIKNLKEMDTNKKE